MKRVLVFSLAGLVGFVFAILTLGVVLHVHTVRAVAPTGAQGTGDVNGDGVVDISDAVFTLLYLFKGGPAPVACADSPELVGRVAALEGTNERIASALEEIAHPCRERANRFRDNGDGTVTDTCTGLMWQQVVEPIRRTWQESQGHCESLMLGGHTDWRLPSAQEFDGMLRLAINRDPRDPVWYGSVDPVFGGIAGQHFWSSTEDKYDPITNAWNVSAQQGEYHAPFPRTEPLHVLAVRRPVAP